MRIARFALLAALAIVSVACNRAAPGGADTPGDGAVADLQAEVSRLEARLRTLATATGCDAASQCRTVPVGERACGGPREYVVYCPASTDEGALVAVADSLRQAEMRLNEATGAVSTCEMRLPPDLEISAGACRPVVP